MRALAVIPSVSHSFHIVKNLINVVKLATSFELATQTQKNILSLYLYHLNEQRIMLIHISTCLKLGNQTVFFINRLL